MIKLNLKNILIFILTTTILMFAILFSIIAKSDRLRIIGLSIVSTLSIIIMIFWFTYYLIKMNKSGIQADASFNILTNKSLIFGKVGMITFSPTTKVITAVSQYLEKMGFKNLVGKSILELNPDLDKISSVKELVIEREGRYYDVQVFGSMNTIIIKDVTSYREIYNSFVEQQSAIILLKVGYYDSFTQHAENYRLKINQIVSTVLRQWSEDNNAYLKLTTNDGDSNIILLNKISLQKSILNEEENILTAIKNELNKEKIKAIISVGISSGNAGNRKLGKLAQEALEMAENRGGDQVVIKQYGIQTQLQSGLNEKEQPTSMVPAKIFLNFLENEIKISDKVIIASHHYADLDAVASMAAVEYISSMLNTDAYMLLDSTETTAHEAFMETMTNNQVDRIISIQKAQKMWTPNTLLVVVDTSSLNQTPLKDVIQATVRKKRIAIIDHHRPSEDKINTLNTNYEYIDVSSSSSSEILSDMISILTDTSKDKIDEKLANLLLTGIYLDTKQLTRKTTHKTLNASSWLASQGANPAVAHNYLKINLLYAQQINEIENNAETYKGKVIISHTDISSQNIGTLISLAAEKLSDIKDIKGSFVIAEIEKNKYRVSARSNDDYNIQSIVEAMGGGGHFNAAAFEKSNITLEELIKELKYNIDISLEK